jgi:sialate O-acetylesterase
MASVARAAIEVSSVFSDRAVLQCDQKLPVWGWGEPGAAVSVRFAGQTVKTSVAADGSWRVTFNPVKASYAKYAMVISVGADSVTFSDLAVGEVWLCAGQSNMLFILGGPVARISKDEGYQTVMDFLKKEKDTAQDPYLRMITVPNVRSLEKGLRSFEGRWLEVAPANNGEFSATAYFFAKELRQRLDCPVGILACAWGGQRIDGFIPPSAWKAGAEKKEYETRIAETKAEIANYDVEKAKENFKKARADWEKNKGKKRDEPRLYNPSDVIPSFPGAIYNGMIHPLVPYAIRGVLWYQGESHNRSNPKAYGHLMEMLVSGLRAEWGQGEFPFYYCQLANLMAPASEPLKETPTMVEICNQQRLAMKRIPNAGMAVLNDIGQTADIHPKNKLDVGRRLSRWALNKTYGFADIVPSGPFYSFSKKKGASIIITFDYPGSGLMVGQKKLMESVVPSSAPLRGFEICGEDRQWRIASAKIVREDAVEVSDEFIQKPVAVRYAWQANPTNANLYNKQGLPASLFTTENP